MKADFLIKNGRVVDPSRNFDGVMDIAIRNARIIGLEKENGASAGPAPAGRQDGRIDAAHIIDASGLIVAPGLIDFHTHVFYKGSSLSVQPDLLAAQGTTAAVDAGTAGTANFEAFYNTSIASSAIRLKGFLTVYSGGQLDGKLCEDFNPKLFNLDRMERLVDKFRSHILGLKIRLSKGVVPEETKVDYLKAVVELADCLNHRLGTDLKVCVHTTNSPVPAGELAGCLRPGDIFCHCFQGGQNNLILPDGSVDPGVLEARKRGVIFDAANGKSNFALATARQALSQGFLPDIISTDLTSDKLNIPPYAKSLPVVLSKYLTLGMGLMDVLRAATAAPAKAMKMEGEIGTLTPGAYADVVLLEEKHMPVHHRDWKEEELTGNELLVPKMTICGGEILYCAGDFWV